MLSLNYWVNTSSNDIIRRFLSKAKTADRNDIEQLVNGITVIPFFNCTILLWKSIVFQHLSDFRIGKTKIFIITHIMLIDEYDVPLDKAYQAGYYDSMVEFIRILFGNAFKTNDSRSYLPSNSGVPLHSRHVSHRSNWSHPTDSICLDCQTDNRHTIL